MSAAKKLDFSHRPPIVDIRSKKAEQRRQGRRRDEYLVDGPTSFDIELLPYVHGPASWLGLFSHAPHNADLSYSYTNQNGVEESFRPVYFKGPRFSLRGMLSCMKASPQSFHTTFHGLGSDSALSIEGPALNEQAIKILQSLIYHGRLADFRAISLCDLLSQLCIHSNSDEFLRALFNISILAKVQTGRTNETMLPLFKLTHQTGLDFLDTFDVSFSLEQLKQLSKETIIDFSNSYLASSFLECLAPKQENGRQLTYVKHMTRYFNPASEVMKPIDQGFYPALSIRKSCQKDTFHFDSSALRLLSFFCAFVPPSKTVDETSLTKTFALEDMAAVVGKRHELKNDKKRLVERAMVLASLFFGKIQILSCTLKITYALVSQGLKMLRVGTQNVVGRLVKKISRTLSARKHAVVILDQASREEQKAAISDSYPRVGTKKERLAALIAQGHVTSAEGEALFRLLV